MDETVKTFSLCSNQRKLLSHMDDAQKAKLLDALFAYNDGEEVAVNDPLVDTVLMVMTETIERMRRFADQKKANGQKGGRPKKERENDGQNETKANQEKPNETKNNQNKPSETKANQEKPQYQYQNEDILNTPLSPCGDIPPQGESKRRNAKPMPTVEEVQAYCDERGNGIQAEHFCDYYSAQGWKLANGQHMKDWKAAVRLWEQRDKERSPTPATVPRSYRQQTQAQMDLLYQQQNREFFEREFGNADNAAY